MILKKLLSSVVLLYVYRNKTEDKFTNSPSLLDFGESVRVVGIEHHFIFDNSRVNCNRIPFCNSTSLLPTITRKRTLHTCGVYILEKVVK